MKYNLIFNGGENIVVEAESISSAVYKYQKYFTSFDELISIIKIGDELKEEE